jgi:hypothetical protein
MGIKVRCYGTHVVKNIAKLGNIMGTHWEPIGNLKGTYCKHIGKPGKMNKKNLPLPPPTPSPSKT